MQAGGGAANSGGAGGIVDGGAIFSVATPKADSGNSFSGDMVTKDRRREGRLRVQPRWR